MLGGFFNNMYYGKGNKADYTPDNLPANRRALFFEMLKVRWSGLITLNIIYLIFLAPFIFWGWMNLQLLNELIRSVIEGGASALPEGLDVWSLLLTFILGNFVALLPAGPATAGVARVCRCWARDESAWVWTDFWQGFRENWKQSIATVLLGNLLLYVMLVAIRWYFTMASGNALLLVPGVLMIVLLALITLTHILLYPMMVSYELSFKHLVRNAFILTLGRAPWSLLFGLLAVLPLAVFVVTGNGIVMLVALIYYALFGLAFMWFLFASYANWVFDTYINPRIDGAPIGMGLRKDEDEWEDQEQQEEGEEADPEPKPEAKPEPKPEPEKPAPQAPRVPKPQPSAN